MNTRGIHVLLAVTASLSAVLGVAFLGDPALARDPRRPDDAPRLAEWLASHPADWVAAAQLADSSLDSSLPRRVEVWRAATALSSRLAPGRANSEAGFVRAGLFHWQELSSPDRAAVLATAGRLLETDRALFASMAESLWQLTHDLEYLRRIAPDTLEAKTILREIAVVNGRFDEYRELREETRKKRLEEALALRSKEPISRLVSYLPQRLDTRDTPLVEAVLHELESRPGEHDQIRPRGEDLAVFALDHRVEPIAVLAPLLQDAGVLSPATHLRLARALGRDGAPSAAASSALARKPSPAWEGTCSAAELCSSAFKTTDGPLVFTASVAQSDEIAPYLEIYVDDALVAEDEVRGTRTFEVGGAGTHRVEVRLVNQRTRNGIQRRVRLS